MKPVALFALLIFAHVPAFANTVSQDQALDRKLGLFGGSWNLPPASSPTGGEIAPTQIKMPLPPSQQQPMPPAPVAPPPPTRIIGPLT